MRAISLATNENEDQQQNELRSLQSQLEATTNLVQNLSTQLAELRDHVRLLSYAAFALLIPMRAKGSYGPVTLYRRIFLTYNLTL